MYGICRKNNRIKLLIISNVVKSKHWTGCLKELPIVDHIHNTIYIRRHLFDMITYTLISINLFNTKRLSFVFVIFDFMLKNQKVLNICLTFLFSLKHYDLNGVCSQRIHYYYVHILNLRWKKHNAENRLENF